MVDSDIKLDGNKVIIEGNFLDVTCHDLKLDFLGRRKKQGGVRRALVHGFNDELVINWAKDYPGGTVISGDLKVDLLKGHLNLEGPDLKLDNPGRRKTQGGYRRALVHGFNDELVINWAKDYPGGTVITGDLNVKDGSISTGFLSSDILTLGHVRGNLKIKEWLRPFGKNISSELSLVNNKDQKIVKISLDDFTEYPWPEWPGEGVVDTLNVIKEMRIMKKELLIAKKKISKLEIEVEKLKSG